MAILSKTSRELPQQRKDAQSSSSLVGGLGKTIERFLLQNLNSTLDVGENSYTGSFSIKVAEDNSGFLFIPNLPVSYALDAELYFKIAHIAAGVLYPYKTLLVQNNAYFLPRSKSDPNTARAFYFPLVNGIPTRLTIDEPLQEFIKKNSSETALPLMANDFSLDMAHGIKHIGISGTSGSGKSFLAQYLIENLASFSDIFVIVDPKLSSLYQLGKRLNVPVLAPKKGANLNGFISEVNEKLGEALKLIYQRQEELLNNPQATFSKTYIVIDELLALTTGAAKASREAFSQLLMTIALLGRETGVSLFLISQRFDHTAFGGNVAIRDQINCSILLGEVNKNTAQFLFPDTDVNSIVVPSGVGTGIIKIVDGQHHPQIMPFLAPTYRIERTISYENLQSNN
ncbi:MAG: cell division protein FtsK [Streptococcus orisratti]|nr:cell division protein FtsK [Streptococcus orisratti]